VNKKGIAVAGNVLVDIVKNIDSYPKIGMLSYISDISYAVGGCVPNVAIDLAKIDCNLPISAIGRLGSDENGQYVLSQLKSNGITTDMISFSDNTPTGFSDVMSLPGGERTFFHQKGTNAEFSPEDIDISSLGCDILHIGYILLLDKFDEEDIEYGTVMARFLHDVQKTGIKTSIDVVSDNSADYGKKIIPALKYSDYVIINEIECCKIWNTEAYKADGSLDKETLISAMKKTVQAGIKEKLIVHSKETAFIMDAKTLDYLELPSLLIPDSEIKGSVGAGDAFCAGSLYGLYNGFSDMEILEFASSAAACNLFEANAVDGMKNKDGIIEVSKKYPRRKN